MFLFPEVGGGSDEGDAEWFEHVVLFGEVLEEAHFGRNVKGSLWLL